MGTQTQTKTELQAQPDSVEQLLDELSSTNTKPLWSQMTRLNPPLPNPRAIPFLWQYDKIRPYLLRAGNLVTEKQAERRVLLLVNPAMEAPYCTDTVNAGLQLVMPNETAPAHRHTAFAMRFIIEGTGGFTAVHGKRITMQRGDVILTPSMNWHDHGKDGSGPMIWLDTLDLPCFKHYPVHFVEHYADPRYPAKDVDSSASPMVFSWNEMQAKLDAAEGPWVRERYLKANGQELSKTLGGAAERLNRGSSSPVIQETSSAVYHVYFGQGHSMIGEKNFDWKQGDTFCVPAWQRYQHSAHNDGPAYLYRVDDQPMVRALGFYRTDETDVESLVSE